MMYLGERGYTHLKFFPAEAAGGANYLKSIASPLPQFRICPTGGVSAIVFPSCATNKGGIKIYSSPLEGIYSSPFEGIYCSPLGGGDIVRRQNLRCRWPEWFRSVHIPPSAR